VRPPTIVTVVTSDYFHCARALAASLRESNPAAPFAAVVADRAPHLDPAREAFRVVFGEELGIADWPRFAFQYNPFDLSCALKPHALAFLLGEPGVEALVYLDGDIQVYGPLEGISRQLETAAIVLTPHLSAPLPDDGKAPSELGLRRAGAYNGGFLAVRRGARADEFLAWWRRKVATECINDPDTGIVVDQSWLDLVPGLFEDVRIERGAEYNVAYWNLPARRIERDAGGRLLVNGRALAFFHFSGWRPETKDVLSIYQSRLSMGDQPVVGELATAYAARLEESGMAACRAAGYTLGRLSDGTPIAPEWREAIRLRAPAVQNVADPFDVSATPNLVARFRLAALNPALHVYPRKVAATAASLAPGWRRIGGRAKRGLRRLLGG
jgi:hypothetical protein